MSFIHPHQNEKFLLMGRIIKAHGIKGEVRLQVYNPESNNICLDKPVYLGKNFKPYHLLSLNQKTQPWIVQLSGVVSRNDSEALRDFEVYCHRDDLAPLAEGEVYLNDLLGYQVVARERILGLLKRFAGNEQTFLWVIEDQEKQELILHHQVDWIGTIDHAQKKIFMNLPEGFAELNKP